MFVEQTKIGVKYFMGLHLNGVGAVTLKKASILPTDKKKINGENPHNLSQPNPIQPNPHIPSFRFVEGNAEILLFWKVLRSWYIVVFATA